MISFRVYREENDVKIFVISIRIILSLDFKGIIEVRRLSGRYTTKLSYRDIKIYGLRSKPNRITVNENSQAIESSKCIWDEQNQVKIIFKIQNYQILLFFLN